MNSEDSPSCWLGNGSDGFAKTTDNRYMDDTRTTLHVRHSQLWKKVADLPAHELPRQTCLFNCFFGSGQCCTPLTNYRSAARPAALLDVLVRPRDHAVPATLDFGGGQPSNGIREFGMMPIKQILPNETDF